MAVVHQKGSPLFGQAINYGLGGVACLVTSFFMVYSSMDFLHVIGIGVFLLSGYLFSQCSRRCSGSWGEHKALSALSKELPDQYHLFVNVSVHEKMESDMVVVGPIYQKHQESTRTAKTKHRDSVTISKAGTVFCLD